jgi:hypothetical protein
MSDPKTPAQPVTPPPPPPNPQDFIQNVRESDPLRGIRH